MGQRRTTWLWPTITDIETARQATRQGVWAAIITAAITALFAGLSLANTRVFDIGPGAFVDAALMLLIAIGIRMMSRVAAVVGLGLYLLERLIAWQEGSSGASPLALFFVLMFINAIRGTFAFHRFKAQMHPGSPTLKP